jgi:hypothetical protein
MEPRIQFRAWGGAVLTLALVSVATPALAGTGDDRTGDLRPEAAAVLDAAATHGGPFTLDDARAIGAAPPRQSFAPGALAFDMPATIRVWRRGIDGSTASCSGRVDVIPLEKYVKGVLPHEWIRSWDDESLKAGAVAIRTYAAWWVNAGGKYSCADLDDTTASQVYKDEFFAVTDTAPRTPIRPSSASTSRCARAGRAPATAAAPASGARSAGRSTARPTTG